MNRLRFRRTIRDQNGQAVIETAVVLPLFFLCVVGIFEFGLTMFSYCSATYAAREAARYASMHSSSSLSPASVASVTAVVRANLWTDASSTPAVVVCWGGGCSNPANNLVGNLVGVGVVWWNPPFLKESTKLFSAQAYRIIIQ